MDFGNVLRRAWQIVWKFKVLWIFGILASCGQSGTSGGSNSGYQYSGRESEFGRRVEQFFNQLDPAIITILIIGAVVLVLVLVVLAILLGTVGRVGLIRGTLKAEQGAERLTFGELWRDGLTYFWRVFGLNLAIGLLALFTAIALVIAGTILTIGTLGIFLICLIPLLCLLIPVGWALAVVIEQANIALVVENLGILEAINRGWQVVRDNIGSMIVMSLILFLGVGLIGGAIIGLPLLIVIAPALAGYATGTFDAIRNGWIVSGVFFVIYLPILLLLSGFLKAYISSAWTLTFLRLTTKASPPQIEAPGATGDITPPPAEGN